MTVVKMSCGEVVLTLSSRNPVDFAAAPFASGVPIVRKLDACAGGAHDGDARGAPCVLFGELHCLNAGTSGTRRGDAPWGRTCDAPASGAVAITPSAARPSSVLGAGNCRRIHLI
jgi:hypothetical protein